MGIAAPSTPGSVDSSGLAAGATPGSAPERKTSRSSRVRASAGGITALGGPSCPTKVPCEGTNPCTRSSFATKNIFDVLQDLSESIS